MKWTGVESELGVFSPSSRQLLAASQLAKPEHCTLNLSSISLRYIWEVWPGKARHQPENCRRCGMRPKFRLKLFQRPNLWILDLWQTSQDTALAIIISHNFRFLPGRLNLLLLLANHPCPACHLQAWTHSHKRVVVYNPRPTNCLHYNLGCNCPIRLVCKC